jgi:hypothetical protein
MKKHPLDIVADNWISKEDKFFEKQSYSEDFFELKLTGYPKTGSQIEDWCNPPGK